MKESVIKAIREFLQLTQEGFARKIGVSFPTVNKWENGRAIPSPLAMEKLKALAKLAKMEISFPPRLRGRKTRTPKGRR